MYLLYSVLTFLVLVAAAPWFLYQALRHRKYVGTLRQRLGRLPVAFNLDGDHSIWIHAVSVGEVLSVRPLIADLRLRYPRLRVFLSTTTRSGQQLARRHRTEVDGVFYFPFDWTFAVRRTLDVVKPKLFVMVETEIWPNLLRECRRRDIRTVMVNGRISNRSFPRYRLVRPLFRRVLADVDHFCAQGDDTARKLVALGADPARVSVTGSLKFDAAADSRGRSRGGERVLRFFRLSPHRPVLVAGSTMRGEETAVLRAFNRIRTTTSHALLVVAARHPERFDEVERLCRAEGLSTMRRTDLPIDAEPRVDCIVLDTIGELAPLYQIATVVFVGGSIAPFGGHNILEPALFGKPIVYGPHMENFAEISEIFRANAAAVQVASEDELENTIVELMDDPVRRARLGAAAGALIESNRGAKDKTLADLLTVLPPQRPGAVVRPFRVVH
ncbi:MAG: 3-deoxy-D-manno-octulosonic acid transferase [Vicinamibacterales bacterium]